MSTQQGRVKVMRGAEVNRQTVTPNAGELIATTDLKEVYLGDGITPGGVRVNPYNVVKAAANQADPTVVGSLSWWITRMAGNDGTVLIMDPLSVTSDYTVPENICLKFEKGGKVVVAEGVTLTINGSIEAGLWHIFDGPGTVTGSPKIEAVYLEWFSFVSSSSLDQSSLLNKVLNSFSGSSLKFVGTKGKEYAYSNHILVTGRESFIFEGNGVKFYDLAKDIECYDSWDNSTAVGSGTRVVKAPVGFEVLNVPHVNISGIELHSNSGSPYPAKAWTDVTQHLRICGSTDGTYRGVSLRVSDVKQHGLVGPYFVFTGDNALISRLIDVQRSSFFGFAEYDKVETYDCEIMPNCGGGEHFSFGDCGYVHWHHCYCDHGYNSSDLSQASNNEGWVAPGRKSVQNFWSFGKVIRCDRQLIENLKVSSWSTGSFIDVSGKDSIIFRNSHLEYPCGKVLDVTQEWQHSNIDIGNVLVEGISGIWGSGVFTSRFADSSKWKSTNKITSRGVINENSWGVLDSISGGQNYTGLAPVIYLGPNNEGLVSDSPLYESEFRSVIEGIKVIGRSEGYIRSIGPRLSFFSWRGDTVVKDSYLNMKSFATYSADRTSRAIELNSRLSLAENSTPGRVIFKNCVFEDCCISYLTNVVFESCIFVDCLGYVFNKGGFCPSISFFNCEINYTKDLPLNRCAFMAPCSGSPEVFLDNFVMERCKFTGFSKQSLPNMAADQPWSSVVRVKGNQIVVDNIWGIEVLDSSGAPTGSASFFPCRLWANKRGKQIICSGNKMILPSGNVPGYGGVIVLYYSSAPGDVRDNVVIENNSAASFQLTPGAGSFVNLTICNNVSFREALSVPSGYDSKVVSGNSGPLSV